MNKIARFLYLFFFLTSSLAAQLGALEILALDVATGLPVEDAFVIVQSPDQEESGFTDANGEMIF